jgi:hypothetical protein
MGKMKMRNMREMNIRCKKKYNIYFRYLLKANNTFGTVALDEKGNGCWFSLFLKVGSIIFATATCFVMPQQIVRIRQT